MAKKGRKGKADRPVRGSAATAQGAAGELADDRPAFAAPGAGALADAGAEPPANRGWSNALIAGFLLLQLVVPLRYYLGGGGYDERFSWRMFSTLRMQQCKVKVEETVSEEDGGEKDTRRVDLGKTVQIAWIGMLERYRRPVVDKLLRWRCEQREHARSVRYQRDCTDTDGSKLPRTEVSIDCASGRIDANEGASEAAPALRGGARKSAKGAAP